MKLRNQKLFFLLVLSVIVGLAISSFPDKVSALSQTDTISSTHFSDEQQTNQQDAETQKKAVIYFFWGETCPHCAAAKPVLQELADQNPQIEFKAFEVYNDPISRQIFFDMGSAYNFEPRVVPTIMLADRVWEGFNDAVKQEILDTVNTCLTTGCTDLGADVMAMYVTPEPTPEMSPTPQDTTEPTIEDPTTTPEPDTGIKLPLIGTIDLSKQSMFISTILIAFVDGFNPCSIWVLTMLLTITLRTGSRKKILIIGFVFLFVTSFIYALFIAGLFTVFSVISFVGWIRVVVALVSLFFGLVNLKDYFWYKEGLSFTIDDKKKPGIYKRIRRVMDAGSSFWALVGGTIILAAGVSLVEFSCTAGFPVLWTNLLTSQQVNTPTFIGLLLLYMIIYNIIALGIFLAAVFTLKSGRIEEKHGRILKLIGGILMVTLAVVMVVDPSLMSDLNSSLLIFVIAFGVTLMILLLHRVILPKLGIHMGTDEKSTSKKNKSKQVQKKK